MAVGKCGGVKLGGLAGLTVVEPQAGDEVGYGASPGSPGVRRACGSGSGRRIWPMVRVRSTSLRLLLLMMRPGDAGVERASAGSRASRGERERVRRGRRVAPRCALLARQLRCADDQAVAALWQQKDDGSVSRVEIPLSSLIRVEYGGWCFVLDHGFREGFDLLLVSDASAPLGLDPRTLKHMIKPARRTLRLVDIAPDQVRGLRSRAVVTKFGDKRDAGAYFRMGNTVERISAATGRCTPPGDYLSGEDVEPEATLPTTLRRLTASEFTRLRRHGFKVADATLATRLSGRSHPVRQPDRRRDGLRRIRQECVERAGRGTWILKNDRCLNAFGW